MHSFDEWINKLKNSNQPIIVEGKKDKLALERFEISNIITLSKYPIYKIVEDISSNNKKCILLVDLDKEGKKLYNKLRNGLQRNGVKVNNKFRNFLFRETKLSNIEGLVRYKNV